MKKSIKKPTLAHLDKEKYNNYRIVYFCALFFFLLIPASLFPQDKAEISLNYKHYGIREGLGRIQARQGFQDSFGYIWIVTIGGISRFDGKEFTNFTENDVPNLDPYIRYINQHEDIIYIIGLDHIILFYPDLHIESFKIPDNSSMTGVRVVSNHVIT